MTSLEDQARAELQAESALRVVPLNNLLTTPAPAPPYAIAGLVPRRVVTLLAGHGGAGKSNIGLTLAAHLAGGAQTWAGFTVEDGRAIYVSLEDPGDVVRHRLRKIVETYSLDAAKIERRLTVLDGTAGDATLAGEVNDAGVRRLAFTATLAELADAAQGHRLIVIDNASDAFSGNENERRQVRAFIRELARIAVENDAGLILLAHIDKNAARHGSNGQSFSGSTAWHNSARSRLALIPEGAGTMLVHEKANHGPLADPVSLEWTDAGVLVPVARSAGAGGQGDAEAVLGAMRAAEAAGVDVGAGRTGPATAQVTLSTFEELPERLRGTRGRRAFWAAMSHLVSAGKVERAEITTGQRKKKTVLRCAGSEGGERARANSPHPYAFNGAHRVRGFAGVCADSEPAQTGAPDDAALIAELVARFESEATS